MQGLINQRGGSDYRVDGEDAKMAVISERSAPRATTRSAPRACHQKQHVLVEDAKESKFNFIRSGNG